MRKFFRFVFVGLSGVFVNEGLLYLFTEFGGLFYLISSLIAVEASIITNFLLNDSWTFHDRRRQTKTKRLLKFNGVSIGGLLINLVILFFLTHIFNLYYLVSNIFGIGVAVIWNYLVNLRFTWASFKEEKIEPPRDLFVSIIAPTYNEEKNIERLVREVSHALSKNNIKGELIVIDDGTDRTDELAKKTGQELNFPVKVFRRKVKGGLSSAVVDGFSLARGDIIGVIDADLSHPPNIIPKFFEQIKKGRADLVIGSRNVKGGGVEGWPLSRKLTSWGATKLAYFLTNVKDPMSGFFMFRKYVIKNVKLNPRGYKIGLELIVKGNHKKIAEVPFVFINRKEGKSKLDMKEYFNYITHVFNMYWHKVFRE